MYCSHCGAEITAQANFCPYCGSALQSATASVSLLNKAASTARDINVYNLVLVSRGSCDAVMAGDLLEDVFGYTDSESSNLVRMAPVVVGENLTAEEAATVAQLYTEYGMEVSVTDRQDQYVDLSGKANTSVFDSKGGLLAGVAAIIGALTVANRIKSYKRYKKPSLLERLFHIHYEPQPPKYRRNFRPVLHTEPIQPRRTIRKPVQSVQPNFGGGLLSHKPQQSHGNPGNAGGNHQRSGGSVPITSRPKTGGSAPGGKTGPGSRPAPSGRGKK